MQKTTTNIKNSPAELSYKRTLELDKQAKFNNLFFKILMVLSLGSVGTAIVLIILRIIGII